jgi:uncharacterized protein (DUF433 family)
MIQATAHRYVVTNDQIISGEPIIEGTRTPVRAIVELWRQGLAPETIPTRLPHLSLAQVFDAMFSQFARIVSRLPRLPRRLCHYRT